MGVSHMDTNKASKGTLSNIKHALTSEFVLSKLEDVIGWARKYSIFQYPFVTACCGMEFMSVAVSHYDIDRFGAGMPRFTPRQADVIFIVGTISHKQGPIVRRVYEQMCEPKWVVAFGACAAGGGPYDNYAAVRGVDRIIPVDVYIPGCPPRPEAVLDGLIMLQERIQQGGYLKHRNALRLRDEKLKKLSG